MENFEIRNHKILKNYSNFSPSRPTEKLKDGRYNSSATKVNESETSQGMRDEEKVMEVPIEGGERERERPSARLQKGRKGLQFARRRASSGQSLSLSFSLTLSHGGWHRRRNAARHAAQTHADLRIPPRLWIVVVVAAHACGIVSACTRTGYGFCEERVCFAKG